MTTDQVSSAQEEQDQADETPEDRKARLAGYGSRRGTREAFARAFRKLLKRRDDAAAVKGQTTVAVAIVATVDELEDGTHRIVACELLRSVGTVQATAVILQAASEVIARELEDPASVRR